MGEALLQQRFFAERTSMTPWGKRWLLRDPIWLNLEDVRGAWKEEEGRGQGGEGWRGKGKIAVCHRGRNWSRRSFDHCPAAAVHRHRPLSLCHDDDDCRLALLIHLLLPAAIER